MIKKIKFMVMVVGIVLTLSACAKDEGSDTQNITNELVSQGENNNNEVKQKEKSDNVKDEIVRSDSVNDSQKESQIENSIEGIGID